MGKHVVATVGEIAPGGRKLVEVEGRPIVIFNLSGEYFALLNRCPHQGGSLYHGKLTGLVQSDQPGASGVRGIGSHAQRSAPLRAS